MKNYTIFDEFKLEQIDEEVMALYNEMQQEEHNANQQIETGVKFEVSVHLDDEAETDKIYRGEDEEHQYLLVYFVNVSVPKSENEIKNQIVIDSVQKLLHHIIDDCEVIINETSIEFAVHRNASDYFEMIKDLFEVRDEFIGLLSPVLECLEIKDCKLVFTLDSYWA